MKLLLILRHAKSPHPEDTDDHERPIFPDARQQIVRLAQRLEKEGVVPQLVLSSDAVRAAKTAQAYARAVGAAEPVLLSDLYAPGEPEDILAAVRHAGGEAEVVLVVGHNPGLEEFCNRITPKPGVDHLATGSVAIFAADTAAWSDLRFREARLQRVERSH